MNGLLRVSMFPSELNRTWSVSRELSEVREASVMVMSSGQRNTKS